MSKYGILPKATANYRWWKNLNPTCDCKQTFYHWPGTHCSHVRTFYSRMTIIHAPKPTNTHKNKRIDRTLKMMSYAPTNAGTHVTSNDACGHCQRYTDNSVFWLVRITLSVITLRNFPPFFMTQCYFRWPDKWVVDKSILKHWLVPGADFLGDKLTGDVSTLHGLSDGRVERLHQLRVREMLLLRIIQQVLQLGQVWGISWLLIYTNLFQVECKTEL